MTLEFFLYFSLLKKKNLQLLLSSSLDNQSDWKTSPQNLSLCREVSLSLIRDLYVNLVYIMTPEGLAQAFSILATPKSVLYIQCTIDKCLLN